MYYTNLHNTYIVYVPILCLFVYEVNHGKPRVFEKSLHFSTHGQLHLRPTVSKKFQLQSNLLKKVEM